MNLRPNYIVTISDSGFITINTDNSLIVGIAKEKYDSKDKDFWADIEVNGEPHDLNLFKDEDGLLHASLYKCKRDDEGNLTTETHDFVSCDINFYYYENEAIL